MADLNDIQAAQSVKIIGSNSSGVEQTPVEANANGKLSVSDISNNGGVNGAITVGTTAVVARVGGLNLANRVSLTIFNNGNGNQTLYWGYSSGVTTANGTPIFPGDLLSLDVGPNTTVYLIGSVAGINTRITENA